MARSQQPQAEEIVFDDLHGVADDDSTVMEVDLDAKDDAGVTRRARTSSDDGVSTGDDDSFDPLHKRVAGDSHADDDGDDDDGTDDGDADDGKKFSKKFNARLEREQRAKRRERTRADDAEAENDRLRRQLKKRQKTGKTDDLADFDKQISGVEADLEQAIEDGNSKTQASLTRELGRLNSQRTAAELTADNDDDDGLDDDDGESRRRPRGNPLVQEWKDSHSDWYGRPGFERQTRIANRLDREVHEDGFDQSDDDYFEELNRRIKKKAPEVFDMDADDGDDDGDGDTPKNPRARKRSDKDKGRSPVASADDASRDGKRSKNNRNKVELDSDDFANMRRFGLDPNKPAEVREYALNKRQVAEEESQ